MVAVGEALRMTPRAYINLIAGILGLLLIGTGAAAVWQFKRMAAENATAAARIEAAEQFAADTKRQADNLEKAVLANAEAVAEIRRTRANITVRIDQAANEDPAVRAYLDERIPDGVRKAVVR